MKFPPWWGYGYFLEPHIPGLDNLRASEPCKADVQGTQVSLKALHLNSTQVSLTVSIYVGGCSCLVCFVHASHVCLAWLTRLARWLAHWPHSSIPYHPSLYPYPLCHNCLLLSPVFPPCRHSDPPSCQRAQFLQLPSFLLADLSPNGLVLVEILAPL